MATLPTRANRTFFDNDVEFCSCCRFGFAGTNQSDIINVHPQDEVTHRVHRDCLQVFRDAGHRSCPNQGCRRVVVYPVAGIETAPPKAPVTAAPRPPVTAAPRPPVTAAPRPPVTAAPRPPVTAAPRPPVTAAPRPPVTAAPRAAAAAAPSAPETDYERAHREMSGFFEEYGETVRQCAQFRQYHVFTKYSTSCKHR